MHPTNIISSLMEKEITQKIRSTKRALNLGSEVESSEQWSSVEEEREVIVS